MTDRSDARPPESAGAPADDALAVMARQCSASSPRGVVAAAAPRAALAGAMALERGGNAYDAVVAAALAEVVLLPPKCGLAGDLVGLAWPAGRDRPEALIAVGPAGAGLANAAERGELTETGAVSVGVPGAPGGYLALAERATSDLAELARPAIDLARDGYYWPEICAALGREAAELVATHDPEGSRYFPGGAPVPAGERITLPGLASALEHLVTERDRFLQGPVGRAIVRRVGDGGGVLTMTDLATPVPAWVDVVGLPVEDDVVFSTPAPTHGPYLLDAVGAAAGSPPGGVYEAVMAAISARRERLADDATSMVSAADADGTLVVVVHSNSYPRFGSGLIVDEFDLVLSNRAGRGFSTEVGHPNFPARGRRPATTLHGWAVDRVGGERLVGATPGGANQLPWNAQSLHRLIGGARPAEAVVGPRWEWLPADDGVRIEAGLDAATVDELRAVAPSTDTVGLWRLRSAMQIVSRHGPRLDAVVDPRTQGAVIGL